MQKKFLTVCLTAAPSFFLWQDVGKKSRLRREE